MAKSVSYLIKNYTGPNVDSAAVKISDYGGPLRDGVYSMYVWGALGAGTVTIYVSPDDGNNWFVARRITEAQATFAGPDVETIFLKGTHVMARLTGSAGAVGLNVGFCT